MLFQYSLQQDSYRVKTPKRLSYDILKIITLDHVNIVVVDLPYSSSTNTYMYMYTVNSVLCT